MTANRYEARRSSASRAGAVWTQDEENYLLRLATQRYSIPQIASALGRSNGAVQDRLRLLKRILPTLRYA